ncbi:MAG: DEAD/DEAH box helicase [Polyangiaceae bacterium]
MSEKPAPWLHPRGVAQVVQSWRDSGKVQRCLAVERLIERGDARHVGFEALERPLPNALVQALEGRGVSQLYSHQAQAIDAARRGRHVVIATPTASGKSLCFHLPVLEELARDPTARALYLYPTKALSRDQEHGVRQLAHDAELEVGAMVYDGDTPGDARRAARDHARIILSNPDMLHAGILPSHTRWAAAFQGLKYVVLDELHTYRGVFGSHMAHVIARLKRVAAFHGASPTFICATATIGNPRDHAARLLGLAPEEIELVDRSGAPTASRQLYVYNPPIVNEELGVRASALKHAVFMTEDLIRAKIPTIVFGQSRNSVEVMLKYLRDRASDVAGPDAIMAYRGGYLPETRRKVEQGLRDGNILCVVSTNALELGIDIGDLSAVVTVGYPGSIAATWQRFGRAGRRADGSDDTSIALMVLQSGALDQYLGRNPEFLLEAGAEEARIDPTNVEVLVQHLKCAAFELPFEVTPPGQSVTRPTPASGENYGPLGVAETRDALDYLESGGLVHAAGNRYHWAGDAFPASSVSLRNIGWDNFVIIDIATGKTLAELDWRATHTMLHEQAIYQQDAEQYQVERLDYDNHKAFVRKVEPDYFTTALTYRTIAVLDKSAERLLGQLQSGWGEIKVVERVTGYKKIKFFTHENAGYGDVHLPEMQMHTTGFWLTVPEAIINHVASSRALAIDGLRGLGRALETVSTLALMCEPSDVGQSLGDGEEQLTGSDGKPATRAPARVPGAHTGGFDPTLFLFDAIPNGVGLAERIFERAPELISRAHELIASCPCPAGCPSCVGPSELDGGRKSIALALGRSFGLALGPSPEAARSGATPRIAASA